MATPAPATFAQLLEHAVNEPGILSSAYRQFHGYSLGNQMAAAYQCTLRGIAPGPLNTFNGWKALGRSVQSGQKALSLCMPIVAKSKAAADADTLGPDETREFHALLETDPSLHARFAAL